MSTEAYTISSPEELGLSSEDLEKFAAQFRDIQPVSIKKKESIGNPPTHTRYKDDLMTLFSADLAGYRLLTQEQLILYIERFQSTHDPQALDQIVCSNVPLVKRIAGKEQRRCRLEFIDLVQHGVIGLMRAAEKFRIELGYQFSTYATWWVVHTMRRAGADFSRPIRLPARRHEEIARFRRIWERLFQDIGKEPTFEDIIQEMKLTEKETDTLRLALQWNTVSLDAALSTESGKSDNLEVYLADPEPGTEDQVVRKDPIALQICLGVLTERERTVIDLRFGLKDGKERTLEQAGAEMHLTRERIRQIEAKALMKMRQSIPD